MRNQVFWVAASYVCDISSRRLEGRYRLRRQVSEENVVRFINMLGRAQQRTGPGSSRVTLWKSHITVSILLGI